MKAPAEGDLSPLDVFSEYGGGAEELRICYAPTPTFRRFMRSTAQVRGVRGPIGSGKTVGCIQELWRLARWQRRQKDGVRRSRFALIRNTYPELLTTTLATFRDWFGDIATIKHTAPITAFIRTIDTETGDMIESEWIFLALDRPQDTKKLKSLELTAAFINEASELPKQILDMAKGRVGRYPGSKDASAIVFPCVIMDTNSVDDDHWWYQLAEVERPHGFEFWSQPAALRRFRRPNGEEFYLPNPEAENAENQQKGFSYWLDQTQGTDRRYIDVYILNEYGRVTDDRPVYGHEYRDEVHCPAGDVFALNGVPLTLGFDFGLRPAMVVAQITPFGQLRLLDEVVTPESGWGRGLDQFLSEDVIPFLSHSYPRSTWDFQVWGDPAGESGAEADNTLNCFTVLAKHGLAGRPPISSNALQPRINAVKGFLMKMVDGQPGLVISKRCVTIRKGFRHGYHFQRVQVSGQDRMYRDTPKKNFYSHVHDAVQYAALGVTVGAQQFQPGRAQRREISIPSAAGWT